MTRYIENFKKFQPLLYELVARDVKIKYRIEEIFQNNLHFESINDDDYFINRIFKFNEI